MQNKQNTKAKVIVIAIAILLCLALVVGITGAFYQAKRRATGTVKMDKGIVIDYTGFGKEADGIWIRENETTFRLFSDSDVQPGEKISLNDAGIKANTTSVDFYARVKLSYEFYNGETKLETLPASFKASDLITTSATFFGSDWVDSGAGDGYYYYATGTALNTFTSSTPADFVDLFDTNAQFIIEGAGFQGAENGGEGGGFVVDETTSINKIVVYLTLETLQGDADAAAEGWKIVSEVDFSKVSAENASIVTSGNGTPVEETLNVTINDATTNLSEVKFPYDEEIVLGFDTKNVDYITLNYSSGETQTFGLSEEDFANDYLSNTQLKVTAYSSKGTVTGYVVGVFSDSEYKGMTYSTKGHTYDSGGNVESEYEIEDGISVAGYLGDGGAVVIPAVQKVRKRNFKVVISGYTGIDSFGGKFASIMNSIIYPCKVDNNTFQNLDELGVWLEGYTSDTFMQAYPTSVTFSFETLCETSGVFYGEKKVKEIGASIFAENDTITSIEIGSNVTSIPGYSFMRCTSLASIIIPNTVTNIGAFAFQSCTSLENITLPNSLTRIAGCAFDGCDNLLTTIGDGWVKVEDSSAVDASTLLKNISYDIKRA